jgi:CheY-like chemotaxis protein
LRQVLINLTGNALKFTSQGNVAIEVTSIPNVDPGSRETAVGLHFAVRDTGPGVSEDRQAAVFLAFEQGSNRTARNYGGTGLGLAISTRIVEMMQGRIWVESPWKDPATGAAVAGSAFHFEIRLAPAPRPAPPALIDRPADQAAASTAASIGPLRILLAEDNAVNQLLAVRRLTKDGHEVLVAGDGEQVLEILQRQALLGKSVDLILMDIQMPKLDGFQTTMAIRERERSSNERIPIIALTAHALEGFRQQSLAAGMDAFVTKPIRFDELRAAIGTVIAGRCSPCSPR